MRSRLNNSFKYSGLGTHTTLQSLIEAGNSYETVLSKSQSRFLSESVGSLALVSTAEDKGVRFGMVLTLFPENRGK